jgi:hypothetical protein
MTLDETITFVEASETGQKSISTLCGEGTVSGQVNKVKTTYKGKEEEVKDDSEKCKFCGKRGHGKSPNFDLKKASCPGFNNKCKQCMRKGHFQDFCGRKPPKNNPESDGGKVKDKAVSKSMRVSRIQHSKGPESTKSWKITKSNVKLMKKQQNVDGDCCRCVDCMRLCALLYMNLQWRPV